MWCSLTHFVFSETCQSGNGPILANQLGIPLLSWVVIKKSLIALHVSIRNTALCGFSTCN